MSAQYLRDSFGKLHESHLYIDANGNLQPDYELRQRINDRERLHIGAQRFFRRNYPQYETTRTLQRYRRRCAVSAAMGNPWAV